MCSGEDTASLPSVSVSTTRGHLGALVLAVALQPEWYQTAFVFPTARDGIPLLHLRRTGTLSPTCLLVLSCLHSTRVVWVLLLVFQSCWYLGVSLCRAHDGRSLGQPEALGPLTNMQMVVKPSLLFCLFYRPRVWCCV